MTGYEAAVVRLIVAGTDETAGLGVLVGRREVVTCAHVVNTALGLNARNQNRPDSTRRLQVEFPLVPGSPLRRSMVSAWDPPAAVGIGGGDVAGLTLDENAPVEARPARFCGAVPWGQVLRTFGYPSTPPRAVGAWVEMDLKGNVAGDLIQAESRANQTLKAQPGYSGGPVWLPVTGEVVGLLHATAFPDDAHRDAYLVPPLTVAAVWEEQFDYLLTPQNPYRGLEAFTEDDAAVFFGREAESQALAERVMARPVTVVVGSSGVGKSSLVQAGLLPRLHDSEWTISIVRPGRDPWYQLAVELLRAQRHGRSKPPKGRPFDVGRDDVEREVDRLHLTGLRPMARFLRGHGRRLLVVIDQFEEIFTDGADPDQDILDLLLPMAAKADESVRLVHTLRSDFLPALIDVPGVAGRLDERLYPVSPLTSDQIRAAVSKPAMAVGVRFEEGLDEEIAREAIRGSLPLLEFTLTHLWTTQRRKTLTYAGYHKMGGVTGALDRFANERLAALPADVADTVNPVLLRLVRTAPRDPDLVTRERVFKSATRSDEWAVLQHLADARLVVTGEDKTGGAYGELAHEALITSWRLLQALVRDNAGFLGWLAAMRQRADEVEILSDARIAEASQWIALRPNDVPDEVKAFVERSKTVAEKRHRDELLLAEVRRGAHDRLTDLPNRVRLVRAVEEAIAAGRAAGGEQVMLCHLDIDHFKEVNDSLGRASADRLLVQLAERLRETAPTEALVARVSGDEFAVLTSAPDMTTAEAWAGALRDAVSRRYSLGLLTFDMTVSAGVALAPEHADDADALIRRVDVALSNAKVTGRPVALYHRAMDQENERRLRLVTELRAALDNGQVVVHFQPKVALRTSELVGVEALVRWNHPDYGPVPSADFVELAEVTGLIGPLTVHVLRTCLQLARVWMDRGLSIGIAVNLSASTLVDATFPDRTDELLRELQVPADRLTFELNESSLMSDPVRMKPVLQQLHEMGIGLSIDGFGTGYSSMALLRRLPVDEIKIDRKFVLGMGTDLSDLAIVRAIVQLGHSLGLRVVAEGVEEELARALLVGNDCDVIQGYLVSRPLDTDRLDAWIDAHTTTLPQQPGLPGRRVRLIE
jgi:diguanylate cyclase (GGDEF)-like protein